jgi:hypothetical protein
MNKVTSFEAACEIRGIDPNNLPDLDLINEEFRTTIIAQYKLMIIRDAIVGDWRPDYNNYGQRKWYPWFWMDSPGFRFDDSSYSRARLRARAPAPGFALQPKSSLTTVHKHSSNCGVSSLAALFL